MGSSSITDRKKDLIVLAGGKKAAPQPIENELKQSPFISIPIVLGDRRKFLAALIVPNFERLENYASGKHIALAQTTIDANPGSARCTRRRSTSTTAASRTTSRSARLRSSLSS